MANLIVGAFWKKNGNLRFSSPCASQDGYLLQGIILYCVCEQKHGYTRVKVNALRIDSLTTMNLNYL